MHSRFRISREFPGSLMTYYRDSSQETPKRQLCPAKRSFPLHPPAHDKVSERSDEKRPPCLLTLSSQEAKAGRQTVDTSSDETMTVPLSAMVFQVCHRTCSTEAEAATKTGPPMFLRFARPVSCALHQPNNHPQVPTRVAGVADCCRVSGPCQC